MRIRPMLAFALLFLTAACGDPTIEVEVPFATVYVSPNDGSIIDASESASISLFAAFNRPIDRASVAGVSLLRGADKVETDLTVQDREVTLSHGELIAGAYTFVLPAAIASTDGSTLGYDLRVRFEVAAP